MQPSKPYSKEHFYTWLDKQSLQLQKDAIAWAFNRVAIPKENYTIDKWLEMYDVADDDYIQDMTELSID